MNRRQDRMDPHVKKPLPKWVKPVIITFVSLLAVAAIVAGVLLLTHDDRTDDGIYKNPSAPIDELPYDDFDN